MHNTRRQPYRRAAMRYYDPAIIEGVSAAIGAFIGLTIALYFAHQLGVIGG